MDCEDSQSGARASRASAKYIDIDIIKDDDMVAKGLVEKRSHLRDGRQQAHVERVHTWGGATDLHINLQIEVGDRNFFLHKFPLLSKSGKLNRRVFESRDTEKDRIILSDIPGGAEAFELVIRFMYGGKFALNPRNVASIRCAADYLEMSDSLGDGNLVAKTEKYLNFVVMGSWRDSITVLTTCAELAPWAEDLEIVKRCSESVAWKCSTDPNGIRWSFSTKAGAKEAPRDWWFDDVCALDIVTFSKVINAVSRKGLNQTLVAAAVRYYAEKWLNQLTLSTTLKTKEESQASFMAFMVFNQDIVAKDVTQAQAKNRAILQGLVNLLPLQPDPMSVKFLLKLLRVACSVNTGSFCKTDLAKRISSQLEKVSLEDLLIRTATGESTYDVDIVQQIVEFYLQDQNYGDSPPFNSPRNSVSGTSISGTTSTSSLSSISSSNLSGSNVTTESSTSRPSVSGSSASDSSSVRSSGTGSSINGSSSGLSSQSGSLSFVSTSSETPSTSTRSEHSPTSSIASSETSSSGLSSDESVKLEKKFFVSEGPTRRSQLPPTTTNFKVAQLLETYLEEVAKDSNISLGKFITFVDLFTEFPRDSDDGIYRVIDAFLRAHPTLTELERKRLCRVIDTGALSLAACVHAASNERLPLRVIVQVLFTEQIKLRNAMTVNDVINDKKIDNSLASFFSTTSRTESSSDPTSSTNSSSSASISIATKSSSNSISSASGLNLGIGSSSIASAVSSQLLGGLSIKETLRSVLVEIEALRKAVQEFEIVKSRLNAVDALQLEMQNLSSRFLEMTQDYTGMTQQMEELSRSSKKSGWSSGWKKVTKPFQSKDHHDTVKVVAEHHKIEPPFLPRMTLSESMDVPDLPALRTFKSETVLLKTPRADTTLLPRTPRADSLPVPKTLNCKFDSELQVSKATPKADLKPTPEVVISSVPLKNEIVETLPPKDLSKVAPEPLNGEAPISTTTRSEEDIAPETNGTRDGNHKDSRKDDCVITSHRRRMSRSASPDHVRTRRHHKDSDSVSVTSTSSFTTTSTTVSSRSGYKHRGNGSHSSHHRDYAEDRHNRSPSRNGGYRDSSLDKHRSRHRHSSTNKSEHSSGHGRHSQRGRSEERPHRSSHHSSEHSHRKHRQKDAPENHSHHLSQTGTNHKDHHSVDSHPRHKSKDLHSSPPSHHSGHQRYKESSEHRSHYRSDHRSGHRKDHHKEESNKHPSHHHRHRRHQLKEVFTDSDTSTDSGTRRRHR